MRFVLATAVCIVLLAALGCSKERRSEKLEGTWYGVQFDPGVNNVTAARKFTVTFGKDGSYKTTATCTGAQGRAKTTYNCDDGAPITSEYKVRKILPDSVTFSLPPSSDELEVEFSGTDTARFRMWQTGLWLQLSRTEPPPLAE